MDEELRDVAQRLVNLWNRERSGVDVNGADRLIQEMKEVLDNG